VITKTLSSFLGCALLTLTLSNVMAADGVDVTKGKNLSEFVSPDGHIDLDAVRKSGYQGPLNLDGVTVNIDPLTGEPKIRSSAAL